MQPFTPLNVFTGAPSIIFMNSQADELDLIKEIQLALGRNEVVFGETGNTDKSIGLLPKHWYIILGYYKLDTNAVLFRLRDGKGNTNWCGDWGRDD